MVGKVVRVTSLELPGKPLGGGGGEEDGGGQEDEDMGDQGLGDYQMEGKI